MKHAAHGIKLSADAFQPISYINWGSDLQWSKIAFFFPAPRNEPYNVHHPYLTGIGCISSYLFPLKYFSLKSVVPSDQPPPIPQFNYDSRWKQLTAPHVLTDKRNKWSPVTVTSPVPSSAVPHNCTTFILASINSFTSSRRTCQAQLKKKEVLGEEHPKRSSARDTTQRKVAMV